MNRPWSHLVLLALTTVLAGACSPVADEGPARVVLDFNEAITAQDIAAAVALVAPGAVQFSLGESHADMGGTDGSLTQDLTALWQTVGAVVFNSVDAYERTVEIEEVRVEENVGTVWTRTQTRTVRSGAREPMVIDFTEAWLLLRLDDEWKIAGVANNRPVTDPGS